MPVELDVTATSGTPADARRRKRGASPTRFDRRKASILDAASVLINRVGLGETTLALVAAEIGLNLKSLRYYFKRREDLVVATYLRSIALHRELVAIAATEQSSELRVKRFVQEYFAMFARVARSEQSEFVYFSDLRGLTEPHASIIYAEYNQFFRDVRSLLQPTPAPWQRSQLNARTHLLVSQLLWSVAWLGTYVPEDFGRVANRFSDILLKGVAAVPVNLQQFDRIMKPSMVDRDRLSQELFLRTATELINNHGHHGASIERISATLNVSRGAFYHHYEARDALVVACFERTFDELRTAQSAAMSRDWDGMTKVAATAVELVTRQLAVAGFMLRTTALTVVGPDLRAEMTRRMASVTLRFVDMLGDGFGDGSVRIADPRIAAEMVTATINSAAELGRWAVDAKPEDVASLYVCPLLYGLFSVSAP